MFSRIKRLSPRPTAVWRGFGLQLDVTPMWREDGFVLFFAEPMTAELTANVLELAGRFQQGVSHTSYTDVLT